MKYIIEYHPDVSRIDILRLSTNVQLRIVDAIEGKLQKHPRMFGLPLRHGLRKYRKLRVGNYRIVYTILSDDIVYILTIQHRKKVYKIAQQRI